MKLKHKLLINNYVPKNVDNSKILNTVATDFKERGLFIDNEWNNAFFFKSHPLNERFNSLSSEIKMEFKFIDNGKIEIKTFNTKRIIEYSYSIKTTLKKILLIIGTTSILPMFIDIRFGLSAFITFFLFILIIFIILFARHSTIIKEILIKNFMVTY